MQIWFGSWHRPFDEQVSEPQHSELDVHRSPATWQPVPHVPAEHMRSPQHGDVDEHDWPSGLQGELHVPPEQTSDPQHCVVCDFLAIAPLSAPVATLTSAGELLPEFVVLRVLPVFGTTVETHLARGPPAA